MATFAVREESAEPIRSGLIAIGLASPGIDFRYNAMAATLLCHSASLLGADFQAMVHEVAPLIPARELDRLLNWYTPEAAASPQEEKGYTTEGTGKQFRYRSVPTRGRGGSS